MLKLKSFLSIFYLFFCISFNWSQPNMQPKKVTEKFFKDYENLKIITPAFKKKRGYTDYGELISFLEYYQSKYSNLLTLNYIGKSQKGFDIPVLRIKDDNNHNPTRIWIQAGLHGNESASTEGVLYLIAELLESHQDLLPSLDISIVPMANIDGYLRWSRYANNGLDLNRDQTKLMAPESVSLKKAFSDFSPQVALDFHEYTPFRRDFSNFGKVGISNIYDAMFLYSGNLNVPKNLRNFTEEVFIKNAGIKLDQYKFTHHPYFSTGKLNGEIVFNKGSDNARSSATSFALTNCISALIEVRGVRIGRSSFKRRTFITYLIGLSFIETTKAKINELRAELIKAKENTKDIYVKNQRTIYKDSIRVIDLEKNEAVNINVKFRDALKSKPDLVRKKPYAYLIKINNNNLVEKLKILGVEVHKLISDEKLKVDQYLVNDFHKVEKKYEKASLQRVSTILETKEVEFSKGTSVIFSNQKNSNLLFEVIEPEAPNSFVSWGVLKTRLNQTLPIYRISNYINLNYEK